MALEIISEVNNFDTLASEILASLDQAVRDMAGELVIDIQQAAPVDTGALRESVYLVTDKVSTYGLATGESKTAKGDVEIHPQATLDGPHEAVVAVAAGHGVFNEFGTSRMAAHPFFTPAVEAARPKFERKIAEALNG